MGHHAGVDLAHPGEQPLFVVIQRVPRANHVQLRPGLAVGVRGIDEWVDRRQIGVGRNDAHFLLTRNRLLAHRFVSLIELTFVPIGPLGGDVVWGVCHARAVVHEERLVRSDLLRIGDELDRLVSDVGAEVVSVFRLRWLFHRVVVVDEIWIPLARFAAEESVEPFEPAAQWPVALCRRQVHFVFGAQVPLAQHVGVVPLVDEHLRNGRRFERDVTVGIREPRCGLADAGHADGGVVPAGEHRGPRW